MITFLPYPDFYRSAQCLDEKRLGKQRSECLILIKAIKGLHENRKVGWQNHPACKMWYGYENSLCLYWQAIILEWTRRGYKDNVTLKLMLYWQWARHTSTVRDPWWLGLDDLHRSYREALLSKRPEHYSKYFPDEKPFTGYYWPDMDKKTLQKKKLRYN